MSLESLNGMEYIGAHIKFKVPGFKEKADGQIYYQILVQWTLKEPYKRQDLSHTYPQCLQLYQRLAAQCPGIPELPPASIFGFKPMAQEVEKRRIDLEKWLMAIVWRCDVIGTREFQEFCNIKNLIEENWLEDPKPSVELKEGHAFGVTDFHYEPDTQVCFVITTDTSIISKMQGFVSLFTGNQKSGPVRSQVICYRLDLDDEGEPATRQLWKTSYINKASVVNWDEQLTILSVGFENGSILVLRVSSERKYREYTEFCNIVKHSDEVTGIATNYLTGQMYSISRDKCLVTTDLANPNNVLKEKEFPYELTCMLQHKDHHRLFVGDSQGSVYIFHYEEGNLVAAHQIKPNIKMHLTSLYFCPKRDFLVTGSKQGIVMVFQMGKPGKERLTTMISQLESVPNQRDLLFSLSTKELYVNFNDNVLVMDSSKVKYLYSLAAHKDQITRIRLYEDLGLLVTSGRDAAVRFWQYKYFTHLHTDLELMKVRGIEKKKDVDQEPEEQKISSPKSKQQAKYLKQQQPLEDLDGWNN